MRNLKVYKGAEHPHAAQNPEKLDVAQAQPQECEGLRPWPGNQVLRRPRQLKGAAAACRGAPESRPEARQARPRLCHRQAQERRRPRLDQAGQRARSSSTTRTTRQYFARPVLQMLLQQPLSAASRNDQYDIMATVVGGGLSGQAGAVRHGISKALTYFEPDLRSRAQEGRLPHARQPRRRAQEVRPHESPPQLPVLQALSGARNCETTIGQAATGGLSLFAAGRLARASPGCHIRPGCGDMTLRRPPATFRQAG